MRFPREVPARRASAPGRRPPPRSFAGPGRKAGAALFAALFLALLAPSAARGAGVTLITHGYNGNITGWVSGMAGQLTNYPKFPGTNSTTYTLALTTTDGANISYQWTRVAGASPTNTDSGEIIVKLDWSQLAGGSGNYNLSVSNVAAAASWVLLQTNSITDLGGHALAELPLHLIGHSRGGSLVNELSRLLGTNGVWVDHLTTLDPHPLGNDGFSGLGDGVKDPSATNTYVNVLFHDNCWQTLGILFDPHGEKVNGAYNRQLFNLSGGYGNAGSLSPDHSNVHLWYHGTIDRRTPASDTEASIGASERTNWWVSYEKNGTNAGFLYSLIGGGDRLSADTPLGSPGFPAIRDGYNQNWDLGAGTGANRTPLANNNGSWPNVIRFDITGTNVVAQNNPVGARLYYQYGGTSNLTMQIYFDPDANPFNANGVSVYSSQPPATGTNSVGSYPGLSLPISNVPPGNYHLYARISDGQRHRYLYAPGVITVVSSRQQPVLGIAKLAGLQFRLTVNGAAGQTIALQNSTNLQAWLPLATNTLTSGSWISTNTPPPGFSRQFYRALLLP